MLERGKKNIFVVIVVCVVAVVYFFFFLTENPCVICRDNLPVKYDGLFNVAFTSYSLHNSVELPLPFVA